MPTLSDAAFPTRLKVSRRSIIAATVGGLALIAAAGLARAALNAGDDPSDVVSWQGTEYAVMWSCPVVRADARGASESATFTPAAGGTKQSVTIYRIVGLATDRVIGVEGPPTVVCSTGTQPGHGVAFSAKTSHEDTTRQLAPLLKSAP